MYDREIIMKEGSKEREKERQNSDREGRRKQKEGGRESVEGGHLQLREQGACR